MRIPKFKYDIMITSNKRNPFVYYTCNSQKETHVLSRYLKLMFSAKEIKILKYKLV